MKRVIKFFVLILISFFTLAFVSSNKVSANMAPNIGVHINIIGDINGKYMTLLYKDKEKGRYSADSAPKDEIDKKFISSKAIDLLLSNVKLSPVIVNSNSL